MESMKLEKGYKWNTLLPSEFISSPQDSSRKEEALSIC